MIRCENGPEYTSAALQNWANRRGIRIEYIQPGNPQQNTYVERFNRTVCYEAGLKDDRASDAVVNLYLAQETFEN